MSQEITPGLISKLKFRAWRRGFRELDLILGPWADTHLAQLDQQALEAFSTLLTAPDWDVYAWITRQAEPDLPNVDQIIAQLRRYMDEISA